MPSVADANRQLVLAYIRASQHARSTGSADDFAHLRSFLAADVVVRLASPWTDEPWTVTHAGADAVIARLADGAHAASSLTTENSVVLADDDYVFVEQRSTVHLPDGQRVSAVGHLFRLTDQKISEISAFRNDLGLPRPPAAST